MSDALQAPPIIFERRCKICTMGQTHSELFKELHFNILEVGMSQNRAMNHYNRRIEVENIDAPKLNNQNLSVHFASHITLPEQINVQLVKGSPQQPALREVNPEMGGFIEDLVRRKVGNEVSDYLNLDQLRARMMQKLEVMDEIVEREHEGKTVIDLEALKDYTTLIKEVRSTIMDLNKIRSSKQLMNIVIKSLVEKATFTIVQQLSREYEQVKKDLLDAGVDSATVIKIDQKQRIKLAEIVAQVARQAVEDTIRTYKLS
jgi:hypothetical protein